MPRQAWLTGLRRSDTIRTVTATSTATPYVVNYYMDYGNVTTGASLSYTDMYQACGSYLVSDTIIRSYPCPGSSWLQAGQNQAQNQPQNQAMNQAGLGQAGRREASKIEISTRAEALLVSSLNPEQTAEFRKRRQFTLHSKDGKRTYIITYGIAGNVFEIERGQAIASYCIHPTGVPTEDVMLAQKLMLETDEESFLKIANRTSLRGYPPPRGLAVA